MPAATLFDKLWSQHVVAELGDGFALLHVDRHLVTDAGSKMLKALSAQGQRVRHPGLHYATPDHAVTSAPGRAAMSANGLRLLADLRRECALHGVRLFDLGQPGQGIVHVMGPELGLTLPGALVVCSDSHTCTHGGLGALAFGIGASEFRHVALTQTLVQARPKTMRITFAGTPPAGTSAKDLILHTIGRLGAGGAGGYAVEYAGAAVQALPVEGRLTLCNLSIEMGARIGLVAPDETAFEWLRGRAYAPQGALWEAALAHWRTLRSDAGAVFDRELHIDCATLAPQVTWGTSPEQVVALDARIPDPAGAPDPARRATLAAALDYMGLAPGAPLAGTPVDWVFIGSCTNARLGDLRAAADVVRGRRVAPGVTAWVVPGSETVKRDAEAEGLDRVFTEAGFAWREPGCAMCVAANGETVPRGARCVSTSNRNFVGRQGPGARTHLASPVVAAASAIAGAIADPRSL